MTQKTPETNDHQAQPLHFTGEKNPDYGEYQIPEPSPVTIVQEPLKIFLQWESPIRPFKKREREFYTTAGSIIFLVCIILLFIKEFLLIMVLISLAFFLYILNTVKPEKVRHEISNKGIKTGTLSTPQTAQPEQANSNGKLIFWDQLGRFWFDKQWDDEILYIENYSGFPSRLMILLGEVKKQDIEKILSQYLIQEKPEKTQIERAGEWLQKKIPLETEPSKLSSNSPHSSNKPTKK